MQLEDDWFSGPIPAGVSIGEGSWLYSSYAFLHCHSRRPAPVSIGKACGIYCASLFNLGPSGEVAIGDYTTLVSVIISVDGAVKIGNYCLLAHQVVIADDHVSMPWRPGLSGEVGSAQWRAEPELASAVAPGHESVVLGDDVWVGAKSILLKGARIGDGAIVGAGSVVNFPVPAGAIVAGNPARIVGWADGR